MQPLRVRPATPVPTPAPPHDSSTRSADAGAPLAPVVRFPSEVPAGSVPRAGRTVARYRLRLERDPAGVPAEPVPAPRKLAEEIVRLVGDPAQEVLGAFLLDCRLRLIGHTIAYVGTLSRCAVEPRGVVVPALMANAASLAIWHTHPSGDPSPSTEDVLFTRRVAKACDVVGLKLVDHVIVGEPGRWVSLKDRGGWEE